MRTLIVAAAALLCGTSALAQTATSDQPSNTQVHGQPTIQPNGSGAVAETEASPASGDTAASSMTTGSSASTTMATTTAGGEMTTGATTKVIAMGEHYTVHKVMPDGTVMVKTLTGEEAKLAMKGETPPALASFMSNSASMTSGAGTTTPEQ